MAGDVLITFSASSALRWASMGERQETYSEKEEGYEKAQIHPTLSCVFTLYWIGWLGNPGIRPAEARFGSGGEGAGEVHAVAQGRRMAESRS